MQPVRYFRPDGGWAMCLVVHKGTKWMTLLDVAEVCTYDLPLDEARYLKPITNGSINPRRTRAIILQRLRVTHRARTKLVTETLAVLKKDGFSELTIIPNPDKDQHNGSKPAPRKRTV